MRTRSPLWSEGLVRRLAAATVCGGLALVAQGCDRTPTAGARAGDGPVRLALSTSVVAAPGAVVEAIVSYTANGSSTTLSQDSVIVDTGGADATLALTANVSSCVNSASSGQPCMLDIGVRLKRNGAVLDETVQRVAVTADMVEIAAQPVQLYEVASIQITGPSAALAALEPRDVVQLTATARDRNGATVAGRAATWSVVSGGVTIGATTGSMTAVSVGAAVVRAAMGGRTQDLAVTVGQTSVDTVRVAPLDTTVTTGASFTYRVTLVSGYGDVLTGRPVTYATSNAALATVNAAGLVTAIAPGTATITVTSTEGRGGATVVGTATLRIQPRPQIVVAPSTLTFATTLLTPPPAAQTVAVTNPGGGTVDPISVVTTDTIVTATLNSTTVPATLTVRTTMELAPGTSLQREVRVRSAQPGIADGIVTVTVTGVSTAQGIFSGLVVNANTQAPVSGASVAIRRTVDDVLVHTATTGIGGAWTSIALPAATYSLTVSANGYTPVTVSFVSLAGGPNIPTTPVPTVSLVPTGGGTGVISGAVRDATNNEPVPTATVELRAGANNVTGAVITSTATSTDGLYALSPQLAGTYTVRVSKTGYVDGSVNVTLSDGSADAPTVFLSPTSGSVAWRFVLSWGSSPQDLDAHLTGPNPDLPTRFHVYYENTGSLISSPFAQLDFDQLFGFGPETITIGQQFPGTYRYYVHNFSGQEGGGVPLRSSNARVQVYQANTLVAQYSPPQQNGTYWTVFEITNGQLIPINTIGNVMPSLRAPEVIGPRNTPAARAAEAAAEWYLLGPWTWTKQPR